MPRRAGHPFCYREDLVVVRLAQLLRSGKPRLFGAGQFVRIEALGHVANVEIVLEPRPTLVCGAKVRRFLACPACGNRRCNALGAHRERGWTCSACGRWRGTKKNRALLTDGALDASTAGLHGKGAGVKPTPVPLDG